MKPSLYVIAGPNGAGKTTFAREFLPLYAECKLFVNADLIAAGVSPFSPETAAFRAGRFMLDEIRRLASARVDFGFETTLAGTTYINLFSRLSRQGYSIHIFYLWVARVELAISRIEGRVREGGHDVPTAVVRRRYARSMRNFLRIYRLLTDSWTLFDNSMSPPKIIASERPDGRRIIEPEQFAILMDRFGKR